MSEPDTSSPSEPRAVVKRSRRWSTVWIVPAVALALGIWLVWEHYRELGPLAYIRFETAESVVSGKTEVRCRSVLVGLVEKVDLSTDLQSVIVAVRMQPESKSLLREGSRFWVVKPRVTASDISGLNTIISGSYIDLDPGDGREDVHHFDGLEVPPVTKSSVPGLRLVLEAETAGSLAIGSPIYYKGFEVGRVEQRTFDIRKRRTLFDIFIRKEYAELVHEGTAFWNSSGIDISTGADGLRVRTPSFQAMLSGGASFGVPPGSQVGKEVGDGTVFQLYPNEEATRHISFNPERKFLLFFDQTVRGLNTDAPVEFRGIPLGRVVDISFDYAPVGEKRVPVLIEIDPALLRNSAQKATNETVDFKDAVAKGLRAKLGTASLLTGALFVDIDFVPDAPPAEIIKSGDYEVFPTHSSGLVQLEAKVNAILTKIEALPLEDTLSKFGNTADEITAIVTEARATVQKIDQLLAREETQNLTAEMDATLKEVRRSVTSLGPSGSLQGDLNRTLDELRAALRSFKTLTNTIDDKPNSLIFGRESTGDPVPKARR